MPLFGRPEVERESWLMIDGREGGVGEHSCRRERGLISTFEVALPEGTVPLTIRHRSMTVEVDERERGRETEEESESEREGARETLNPKP